MADPKKPKSPAIADTTSEEVLSAIDLINEAKSSGLDIDEKSLTAAKDLLDLLGQHQGKLDNINIALQKKLITLQKAQGLNSQEAVDTEKRIKDLERVQELTRKHYDEKRRLGKETHDRNKAYHDAETESIRQSDEALKKSLGARKEWDKGVKENVLNYKKLGDLAPAIKEGMTAGFTGITNELITAQYFGLLDLFAVSNKLSKVPKDTDKAIRDMTKNTGLAGETFNEIMIGTVDVIDAQRRGFAAMEGAEVPFDNIGITIAGAQKNLQALTEHSMTHRQSWMEQNKETSIYTTNLMAALEKIDVKSTTSAKILDSLIKAHGETPKEANKSLLSIVSIADSLEISVGDATQKYMGMSDDLAQWGDRATDVFAGLEVQTVATGIESNRLNEITAKWDTFEGASKVVQQFNAAMGETLISVDELVHATPEEKLKILQDAMASTGKSFEEGTRFTKKQMSALLELKTVGEAARIFRPPEEVEAIGKRVKTEPISKGDLRGRIEASMTTQELMEKNLSSLGAGMAGITKEARTAGIVGLNALTDAMAETAKNTDSAKQAAMAYIIELRALAEIARKGSSAAGKGVKTLIAADAISNIIKAKAEEYDVEIPTIMEVIDKWFEKEEKVKPVKKGEEDTTGFKGAGTPGVAKGAALASAVPFVIENKIMLEDGTLAASKKSEVMVADVSDQTIKKLAEYVSPDARAV